MFPKYAALGMICLIGTLASATFIPPRPEPLAPVVVRDHELKHRFRKDFDELADLLESYEKRIAELEKRVKELEKK